MSTGTTINDAATLLKKEMPNVSITALVLFRGKPYWK